MRSSKVGTAGAAAALVAVTIGAVLVGAVLWTSPADAQRRRGRAADLAALRAELASNDADRIRQAIEGVGASGDGALVEPIAERVRAGLPPELLSLALDTLVVLEKPEAGPILFQLARHRRAEIRRKAVEGIVACAPDGAERALTTALSDTHAPVRAAAALGLGQLRATGAIDALFLALDRGVNEASASLGQLARPADVPRLLAYVGRLPFDTLSPALLELLARSDVPEAQKLAIVTRLGELATAEAKAFLEAFVETLPAGRRGRARVREAAEEAIARIAQ